MKRRVKELAILGGKPAFPEPLHVGRPNLGDETDLMARLKAVLDNRWFTNNGPLVQEFEQRLCETLDVEYCVVTSSGTAAIELMLRAARIERAVALPAFTFVGTAHAVAWQGLEPIFCDTEDTGYGVSAAAVESIADDVGAILGVHVWGRPCDVDGLLEVSAGHRVPLFFDAAHAFGCTHKGKPIAQFGTASAFSFHATKVVNAFEGGAIATSDAELAARARLLRNFGFRDVDDIALVGTNAKMSEASAAMGLTSLESYEQFRQANVRNYACYQEGLAGLPGVRLVGYPAREASNFHYVVVEVEPEDAALSRDELQRVLGQEGVLARRYFYPGCHAVEPYRQRARARLPRTDALVERVLSLPTGTAISRAEIEEVCAIISVALAQGAQIREVIRGRP